MCFGYGTSREILVVCDISGSMTLTAENDFEWYEFPTDLTVPGLEGTTGFYSEESDYLVEHTGRYCLDVFRDIVTRAECRCPRWGFAGYFWGSAIRIDAHRFARGISQAINGISSADWQFEFGEAR